jgi:4-hydroxybenzoate polyprenyltransferase
MTAKQHPADALPRHWTQRLPKPLIPLAQLSRLDRPIGWQLLVLPCLMGLGLARSVDGVWGGEAWLALLFLIGAIAMRGAGCTWNDLLDRKIDAKVARTKSRPIPSGAITPTNAFLWCLAQCGVGLAVLLQLPQLAQIVAVCAIPLVAAYPLMKRITWWPQAWLGLCFSWGALVAMAAITETLSPAAWLLFAGCIAWVIAYDTIYAMQDAEDDALIGVRSTARLFAGQWRAWVLGFYVAALFLWAAAAAMAGAHWSVFIALGAIGGLLIWPMLERIDPNTPHSTLAAFRFNALIGATVALAFWLSPLWISLAPLLSRLA